MFNWILNCSQLLIILIKRPPAELADENSRESARADSRFTASDISSANVNGSLEGFMNEISRSSDVRRYTNVTDRSRVLYQES